MKIQDAIDKLEQKKKEGYEFLSLSKEPSTISSGLKLDFWQCPYCNTESNLPIRCVDTYIGKRPK